MERLDAESLQQAQRMVLERIDQAAFSEVIQSRAGRHLLMRIFDQCQLFAPINVSGGMEQVCAAEGRREVALAIYSRFMLSSVGVQQKQLAEQEYNEIISVIASAQTPDEIAKIERRWRTDGNK